MTGKKLRDYQLLQYFMITMNNSEFKILNYDIVLGYKDKLT